MRNGRDLIGMPVVVTESWEEIERIEGLVMDQPETHVSAFLVDSDDWSRQARVLPLQDVQSFGETQIAVSSSKVIHDVVQIPELRRLLNRDLPLMGTRIVTGDGSEIGTVNDVTFDEVTGEIDTFHFHGGDRTNRLFERFSLPLYDELDDEVIVHASEVTQRPNQCRAIRFDSPTEIVTERTVDGRKMAAEASTQVATHTSVLGSDPIRSSAAAFQRFIANCWEWFKLKTWALFKLFSDAKSDFAIQRAIGHRAKVALLDTEEVIVVHQNEVITPAVIHRVREAGLLKDLLGAVDRSAVKVELQNESQRSSGRLDDWWPPFI